MINFLKVYYPMLKLIQNQLNIKSLKIGDQIEVEIKRGKRKSTKWQIKKELKILQDFSNWAFNYCILAAAITNYQTANYLDYVL